MKSLYYLGLNIKAKREQKRLTQPACAELIGVERKTLLSYELGRSFPRADVLLNLAQLFGCSIDELFEEV